MGLSNGPHSAWEPPDFDWVEVTWYGYTVTMPSSFGSIEEVFEYGYCHSLALALSEATGWGIVGIYSPGTPGNLGDTFHYLVRRPDGYLVDVRGVRDEQAVLAAWDDPDGIYSSIVDVDPEEIWIDVHRIWMEHPDDVADLARDVAAILLNV